MKNMSFASLTNDESNVLQYIYGVNFEFYNEMASPKILICYVLSVIWTKKIRNIHAFYSISPINKLKDNKI